MLSTARTSKSLTHKTTVFVYNAMGQLIAEYATQAAGDGTSYLTQDHLGSTRVVTGDGGEAKSRHDYLPFGEEITTSAVTNSGREAVASYSLGTVRQKFTSKERDGETGLDYFIARYYSCSQGRFTSPDPLYYAASRPGDPQQFNLYVYVRNNPLILVDPDGRDLKGSSGAAGASLTEEDRQKLEAALRKLAPGTRVDSAGTVRKPGFFRRLFNKLTGHGAGTTLVSRLVDSKFTTTVVVGNGRNEAGPADNAYEAASNGTGANAIVNWNPDRPANDETRMPDANGNITATSPIETVSQGSTLGQAINLGHELIHADHYTRGVALSVLTPPIEPGGIQFLNFQYHNFVEGGTVYRERWHPEEFKTVGFAPYVRKGDITENQLRKELGANPRATYLFRRNWSKP